MRQNAKANPTTNLRDQKTIAATNVIVSGLVTLTLGLSFTGCATGPESVSGTAKRVLDRSYDEKPDWLTNQDVSWKDSGLVFYKSTYTVRGDQRINACYDLARLGLFETVLTEVRSELKASNDLASEGTSENEDSLLVKSLSETLQGTLKGVRVKSKAFERYEINEVERVDCHILTEISEKDYLKIKNEIKTAQTSVTEDVAQAVRGKQKRFFSAEPQPKQSEVLREKATEVKSED